MPDYLVTYTKISRKYRKPADGEATPKVTRMTIEAPNKEEAIRIANLSKNRKMYGDKVEVGAK